MEEPEKIVSQTELDDKAQKLVEEKDADSRLRVYVGPMEKALTAVLLIWAVFQVWANMFGTLGAVKPIGRRAVAGELNVLVRLTEHQIHHGIEPVHRVRRKQHKL